MIEIIVTLGFIIIMMIWLGSAIWFVKNENKKIAVLVQAESLSKIDRIVSRFKSEDTVMSVARKNLDEKMQGLIIKYAGNDEIFLNKKETNELEKLISLYDDACQLYMVSYEVFLKEDDYSLTWISFDDEYKIHFHQDNNDKKISTK